MTARIFLFHGTEADADQPLVIGMPRHACPDRRQREPLTDDQREDLADEVSDWPTTRRYARSAHGTEAAFPNDPAYADPFERFTRSSFVDQNSQVETLSQKWSNRCIYLIGAGVLIAYLLGAFR